MLHGVPNLIGMREPLKNGTFQSSNKISSDILDYDGQDYRFRDISWRLILK